MTQPLPDAVLQQVERQALRGPEPWSTALRELARFPLAWEVLAAVVDAEPTWRPRSIATLVTGDLSVAGNLVVEARQKTDATVLVVLGAVHCRNLVLAPGATLLCAGDLRADEAIVCTARQSVTQVRGMVSARLLDSGSGAWLDVSEPAQLAVQHVSGYAMVAGKPFKPTTAADLMALVRAELLDTDEWDELDDDEREGESANDYVRVDAKSAFKALSAGESILSSAG